MKRLFISFLSVISALAFVLALASPAWAASGPTSIDLADHATASGTDWNYAGGVFTITGSTAITVTGTVSDGTRIVIDDGGGAGITANLTFSGASITIPGGADESPLTVSPPSTLNLTISNTNTLTGGAQAAGINVESGATLVIDGSGTLLATGGSLGGAGIGSDGVDGGSAASSCGTVTIGDSANLTAAGGGSEIAGAGIGGGGGGNGGNGCVLTISGSANVSATGGSSDSHGGGAGIGGGGGDANGGGSPVPSISTTGLVIASGGSGLNGNNGANFDFGGDSHAPGFDNSNTLGLFVLSASVSGGNGSISPVGSWSVNRGDMSFTIAADSGYAIDSIMDGLTDVTGAQKGQASGTYALSGIAANHAIVVMFGLKGTPPTSVPTLNAWALALLVLLMGGIVGLRGVGRAKRNQRM